MSEHRVIDDTQGFGEYALEYPLSHGQTRLWFLDKLWSGNSFYNLPLAVQLPGNLNHHAFGLALNEVVRRHESLRSCVRERGGDAVAIVMPFEPFTLPITDLTILPKAEQTTRLAEITAQEAGWHFDLAKAPLARFHLVKLAGGQHLIMATMHHIISDGWSMGVFWKELASLYADAAAGRAPQLPEPELQYGDYAVWQREQLSGETLGAQRRFWQDRLAGIEQLDLPTDHPRPAVQEHHGATHEYVIPASLAAKIRGMAQQFETTPFSALLAGLGILLGSYAGQSDIVIGTPVANRDREELENLIGFFVNTLVLRIDLSGQADFATVLKRTARTIGDALSHSDYPFERLVEDLDVARDPSRNPLFQVSAQLFSGPGQRVPTGPVQAAPNQRVVSIDKGTALFDMTWNFWFEGQVIKGQIEFDTDLFDPRRIAAMANAFETVMAAAVAKPETAVRSLPLAANVPVEEFSPEPVSLDDTDLWSRIRASAIARSDEVVLECGDVVMSGEELVSRVERIAAGLQARGVRPEDVVALDMQRSERQVLAALAVMATGGAFMPLNPEDPPARRADILAKSDCRLRICDAPDVSDNAATSIDALASTDTIYRPAPHFCSAQLAYVILTSGSTGTPKAIAQTHGAIAQQIDWLTTFFSPRASDAMLMKTPLVFDASLWELFLPLATGFRLVLGDPDLHRDPRQIVRAIVAHKITMVQLVPSMLRLVLDDLEINSCDTLRLIAAGGEALDETLVAMTHEALPNCDLVNLYGPAETCVQSAVALIARATSPSPDLSDSVGGHRLYLLGPNLQPLPVGHPGELWIGGVGVARGYLNDPAPTSMYFMPDPFAADGSRMYRSGDRFFRRADGRLAYLGRADSQIKRSGVRIETGEIERAMLGHLEVSRAALIQKDGALLLYAETNCAASELRSYLHTRLPKQMLPEGIIPIEVLPVLISGKTDRRALAALDFAPAATSDRPPRSKVDETVALIWAEVLNQDCVLIDQDFFADLGGHSLLATRAIVQMRDLLGIEVPLHLIFDQSTVASIVDALGRSETNASRLAAIEDALGT